MIPANLMLTKSEFLMRFAAIMAEYMGVMETGDFTTPETVTVDGRRLLGVIESLAGLVSDMHNQMEWPAEVQHGLPYN